MNLARGIIQVLPRKVRKHLKGRPVTIPIHPELAAALGEAPSSSLLNKVCENSIRSDGDVASPRITVAGRLVLLAELKAKGLVTSDEYTAQRQRILSEI